MISVKDVFKPSEYAVDLLTRYKTSKASCIENKSFLVDLQILITFTKGNFA